MRAKAVDRGPPDWPQLNSHRKCAKHQTDDRAVLCLLPTRRPSNPRHDRRPHRATWWRKLQSCAKHTTTAPSASSKKSGFKQP
jgi:hypothetical protein